MSQKRSPTGCGIDTKFGGSQPNLSETHTDSSPRITLRNKRKQTDDNDLIRTELSELRKQMSEMLLVLTTSKNDQAQNINKLCQDVTAIKNEVGNISSTIENIITENANIKIKLTNLATITENTEKKVKLLETDVKSLKCLTPLTCDQMPATYDEIVNEIQERNIRAKNIIVVGIPEPKDKPAKERQEYEKEEISKITSLAINDCPRPDKIMRLGKYKPEYTRSIKVSFSSEETVKAILRNRNNLGFEKIKIYSDQTPNQRKYMQTLKDELQRRIANGEANLSIKYIKGKPKIISPAEHLLTPVPTTPKN